jgi:hypothetical protein
VKYILNVSGIPTCPSIPFANVCKLHKKQDNDKIIKYKTNKYQELAFTEKSQLPDLNGTENGQIIKNVG